MGKNASYDDFSPINSIRSDILSDNKHQHTPQPFQPLLRIFNLSYPWVSILPEGEEFFVVLNGINPLI
jgi:hypothetical protein